MEKSELVMLFAALVLFIYFDNKLQALERRVLQIQLSSRYVPQVEPPITEKMIDSIVPTHEEMIEEPRSFTWGPYEGSGFASF
jgi:hypothetical protein